MRGSVTAKIMIVEDNDLLLAALRSTLEREGYDVIAAASRVEMMKLLETSKPDLIVLDIGLPDGDWRDLLASLKKNDQNFSIPVLVWSGREHGSDRRIALELGAEDYVERGLPSALLPKIERVLLRVSEGALTVARASVQGKA
jgi:two-component system, OmpR family, KDP operon response regulator KdpE